MTLPVDPSRNAGIYFAADGYDPKAKGINGRRVAGESFIRGFFRHADVAEFVSLAPKGSDQELFAQFAAEERKGLPVPLGYKVHKELKGVSVHKVLKEA